MGGAEADGCWLCTGADGCDAGAELLGGGGGVGFEDGSGFFDGFGAAGGVGLGV